MSAVERRDAADAGRRATKWVVRRLNARTQSDRQTDALISGGNDDVIHARDPRAAAADAAISAPTAETKRVRYWLQLRPDCEATVSRLLCDSYSTHERRAAVA